MNFLRKQMKWVMAVIVVAFLLSTFLMYEGRGTRRTPGRNADGSMSDYEVATINGRPLMRSELERRLSEYLSSYSTRSAASLDMPAIYQSVLDQLILDSQMAKEVEAQGISISDAEADRAMKDYADRYYPTRETFYQALQNSGVRIEDYKKSLARQMANTELIKRAVGEIVISEDRAVEFYDTMKALIYTNPEGYSLNMADFRTSDDAEYMRSRLIAGDKWEDLASGDALASHDVVNITKEPVFLPSSSFTMGILSPLASLDVGEVSPVFMVSSNDYAVAVKTEHRESSVRPYDEVSADIKGLLTQQDERQKLADYETYLKGRAQVVVHDQEIFARPAVSEDAGVVVEDVIPELAELEKSADAEPEAKPEATETPAVVEEAAQPEVETITASQDMPLQEQVTQQ